MAERSKQSFFEIKDNKFVNKGNSLPVIEDGIYGSPRWKKVLTLASVVLIPGAGVAGGMRGGIVAASGISGVPVETIMADRTVMAANEALISGSVGVGICIGLAAGVATAAVFVHRLNRLRI